MNWDIFLGISALVGFTIAIVTPIIKLNTAITRLTVTVELLRENFNHLDSKVENALEDIDDLKVKIK